MNKIYAKSESNMQTKKTLVEHNNDLLEIFNKIKHKDNYEKIQKILKKYNIEQILEKLYVMHDLGKINIKFQNKINGLKVEDEIRHNILSGAFVSKLLEEIKIENEIIFNVIIKSIIYHHGYYKKYLNLSITKIEESILNDIEEGIIRNKSYDLSDIEKQLTTIFNKRIEINDKFLDYDFINYFNKDFSSYQYNIEDKDIKLLYIFLKGYLNLVDHLASSQIEDFNYFFKLGSEEIKQKIINILKEKIRKNIELNEIQKSILNYQESNIITKAFTGSGKTFADHLWSNERKIFLVPTKISAENFYIESEKIYGEKNVGILHGDINLYNIDYSEYETRINMDLKNINLAHNLAKPYIISTIDQILLSLFKYPNYEKLLVNIYNSKITVDEVHLLNPKMFLILCYFMDFTSNHLNVKYHLMTATLPKIYEDILFQKIDKENYKFQINFEKNIQKNLSDDSKKIKINVINEKQNNIKTIKKLLENNRNKKILIIKNTVNESIDLYKNLSKSEENINLLHSRFKFQDKQKKYDEISSINKKENEDKTIIWITTQLVETSLDIDFDVVISDLAPMESLIQRMGRCNRHNSKEYGKFYILENKKFIPYENKLKIPSLKNIKKYNNKIIGQKTRNEILENYYEEKSVIKYYESEIKSAEYSIRRIWDINKPVFNYEDLIFNYDPYLNIVDNKIEAEKLFRENTNYKVVLEDDFEEMTKNMKDFYKKYMMNSITISRGFYNKIKSLYGARKDNLIKGGIFVLSNSIVNYSQEKGLSIIESAKEKITNFF